MGGTGGQCPPVSPSVPSRAGPLPLLRSPPDVRHPQPAPPGPCGLPSPSPSSQMDTARGCAPTGSCGSIRAASRLCGAADYQPIPRHRLLRPAAHPPRLGRQKGLRRHRALAAWEPGSPGGSRGTRELGRESLTRERAAPPAPARLPGRRRFRPLRPTWGTAARHPKDFRTSGLSLPRPPPDYPKAAFKMLAATHQKGFRGLRKLSQKKRNSHTR